MLRPEIKTMLDDIAANPKQWTVRKVTSAKGLHLGIKKAHSILRAAAAGDIAYVVLEKKGVELEWFCSDGDAYVCVPNVKNNVKLTMTECELLGYVVVKLSSDTTDQQEALDEIGKMFGTAIQ